jgi:hypothetical protein
MTERYDPCNATASVGDVSSSDDRFPRHPVVPQPVTVGRREFLTQGVRLTGTLTGCAALTALLDACGAPFEPTPNESDHLIARGTVIGSVTQSLVVRNKTTGAYISGASVAVDDGLVCWAPKKTNSSGKVTFTTSGIQSIWIRKSGYVDYCQALLSSSATYKVSITPVPRSRSRRVFSTTKAIAGRVRALALAFGRPVYVGRYSLQQLNSHLDTIEVGTFVTCTAVTIATRGVTLPECVAAGFAIGVAETGLWVAQRLGVSQNTKFDFYLLPGLTPGIPAVLIVPAGT